MEAVTVVGFTLVVGTVVFGPLVCLWWLLRTSKGPLRTEQVDLTTGVSTGAVYFGEWVQVGAEMVHVPCRDQVRDFGYVDCAECRPKLAGEAWLPARGLETVEKQHTREHYEALAAQALHCDRCGGSHVRRRCP
jgi:hypothetical protein